MRISLIITTYNRPDALSLVLKSVASQTKLPDEIIIADDGSDNSTSEYINTFKKKSTLKVIHSWQSDKGFRVAKSRNKAIAKSNFEYIILIDGDVVLHRKFIEDHLKHSEYGYFVQGPRVFLNELTTKKFLNTNNIMLSFFARGLSNRKNTLHSNFLSSFFSTKKNYLHSIKTCNLAFYKIDFIRVNGFNNNIEGWGREDSEFVVRLLNSGLNRKNVRFQMIQFHLWHQNYSRTSLLKNDLILEASINKKLKWCDNGINKYL